MHIHELLAERNINPTLFENPTITHEADIAEHAAWVFERIYSIPYPKHSRRKPVIARYHHGGQHVARTAFYIPILAYLMNHLGEKIPHQEIKLLQIAALWHDTGRLDENKDEWDQESAVLLYCYLTQVLGIPTETAKCIAEAVANKDSSTTEYRHLSIEYPHFYWNSTPDEVEPTLYQKLIHDADCLDIIRVRKKDFNYRYLYLFRLLAEHSPSSTLFKRYTRLLQEAKSIIYQQGDLYYSDQTKKKYENSRCFTLLLQLVQKNSHFQILSLYSTALRSFDVSIDYSVETSPHALPTTPLEHLLSQKLDDCGLLFRGIGIPSGYSADKPDMESNASYEFYKVGRKVNIPTRHGALHKHGNPHRSFSLVTWGSPVYHCAGYLIENPSIFSINKTNVLSGMGKKSHLSLGMFKQAEKTTLNELSQFQRVNCGLFEYNEIIGTITGENITAVYFTRDITLHNQMIFSRSGLWPHLHAPLLQAIFIQNEIKNHLNKEVPIIEYSIHHFFIKELQVTPEEIEQYWIEMCMDYIKQNVEKNPDLLSCPINDIKTLGMYTCNSTYYDKHQYLIIHQPADSNYAPILRERITTQLQAAIDAYKRTIYEPIIDEVTEDCTRLFDQRIFEFILKNPDLYQILQNDIQRVMQKLVIMTPDDCDTLFTDETLHLKNHIEAVEAYLYLLYKNVNPYVAINLYLQLLDDYMRNDCHPFLDRIFHTPQYGYYHFMRTPEIACLDIGLPHQLDPPQGFTETLVFLFNEKIKIFVNDCENDYLNRILISAQTLEHHDFPDERWITLCHQLDARMQARHRFPLSETSNTILENLSLMLFDKMPLSLIHPYKQLNKYYILLSQIILNNGYLTEEALTEKKTALLGQWTNHYFATHTHTISPLFFQREKQDSENPLPVKSYSNATCAF